MELPDWLPEGRVVRIPGRGEVFVRVHRHPDPSAPVVLLLHGWTASADTQFLYALQTLTDGYSVIAVDHHGHGRGLRSPQPFSLDDVADDAAFVVRALGVDQVVTVGYSMGGPVSLHLWRRHPELVAGMVFQATALEWRQQWSDRAKWRLVPLVGPALRSWWYPRMVRSALRRLAATNAELERWLAWVTAETLRNDPVTIASAGRALSRYDARPWAGDITVPTAVLLTTRDRLVKPSKQRALAETVRAEVFEVRADHLCALSHPGSFGQVTRAAVDSVAGRVTRPDRAPAVPTVG
jgi:3-oxoadipate enol-lactonase